MERGGAALAWRWYEELFNRGNLAAVDDIVTPDFVEHGPGGITIRGPEAVKDVTYQLRAFPPKKTSSGASLRGSSVSNNARESPRTTANNGTARYPPTNRAEPRISPIRRSRRALR